MFHQPIPRRYFGYVCLIDLGPISFLCMRVVRVGCLLLLIVGRGRRWRWSTSLYGLRNTNEQGQIPPPGMRTLDLPFDAAKDLVWGLSQALHSRHSRREVSQEREN